MNRKKMSEAINDRIIQNKQMIKNMRKFAKEEHEIRTTKFKLSEVNSRMSKGKKAINLTNYIQNILQCIENNKAYVYWFEIEKTSERERFIRSFMELRKKSSGKEHSKRICYPSIHNSDMSIEEIAGKSKVIYVGSKKKNFVGRLNEHLGFGSNKTYSLQLIKWAPEKIKYRVNFIKINNESITYEIEAAMATLLNPLLGKRER